MSKVMFFFHKQAPLLDAIPVDNIQSVEVVGNKLLFNTIDEAGVRRPIEKHKTEYIMNQIYGYNIEIQGE